MRQPAHRCLCLWRRGTHSTFEAFRRFPSAGSRLRQPNVARSATRGGHRRPGSSRRFGGSRNPAQLSRLPHCRRGPHFGLLGVPGQREARERAAHPWVGRRLIRTARAQSCSRACYKQWDEMGFFGAKRKKSTSKPIVYNKTLRNLIIPSSSIDLCTFRQNLSS